MTSLLPCPRPAVCENCLEVDLMAVAGIIAADICLTLGVLLLVYHWSKNRKAKAKPVTRGMGAGGRPGGKSTELDRRRGPHRRGVWPGQGGQRGHSWSRRLL